MVGQKSVVTTEWEADHGTRSDGHLSSQFEVIVGAVTGLYHTVSSVEAGDENHAEAVEVAVAGTAALVLDLRCWKFVSFECWDFVAGGGG